MTLKLFNVTMVMNMSIVIFEKCVKLMELFFVYLALTHLALTHLLKMVIFVYLEKYAPLTIIYIRTLLIHAPLPTSFWHHALEMTNYLLNILPSKTINFESPLKILYHKDPSYSHLRMFGCLCFPLFPSSKIHKLQPQSTKCVFLGYSSNHRGYKCLDIS